MFTFIGAGAASLFAFEVQPPLDAIVLDYTAAHQRHGGGGAYYIYLRRRK